MLDQSITEKKKPQTLQNVVPVCIRQLRDCRDEEFILFGMRAQIVTTVALLKDYEVTSTKATYQIEDHTAAISAVYWLDETSSAKLPQVKEGRYLRVFGSLRTTDGVKSLLVLRMFPVEDINETTTHLLEVIHARLAAEHSFKNLGAKLVLNNPGAELAHSMSTLEDGGGGEGAEDGFNPIQKKLYSILQPIDTDIGLSRAQIMGHFSKNQLQDVNKAIDYLSGEGHIYSTIDNEHYKITGS